MICEVKTAREAIEKLGGPNKVAKAIGGVTPKAVSMWQSEERGQIPAYWADAIGRLLRKQGISASPDVFGMRKIRGEAEQS